MSAPVLIALAHGSRDRRSAASVKELVATTKALRPDVQIEAAFLEHSRPDVDTIVRRYAARGRSEFVIVPLLLSSAYHANVDIPNVASRVQTEHPAVLVRVSEPIGPDPSLLAVLDLRLRESLRAARVRELDALVLTAAGSSDSIANAAIGRLARLWSQHHRLPVKVAFASAAPPTSAEAIREFRRDGRRFIAVGSFFIAPGILPHRASELAMEAGAIAISEPLGAHEDLAWLLLARYSVGALDLVPLPA
jgi:sirohydrochlorin ferrochelatase